jgi:hypothetical protein
MACVGPTPNLSSLTEVELGELAGLVWDRRQNPSDPLVGELFAALAERSPKFDVPSAVAALQALTEHARDEPGTQAGALLGWVVLAAAQVVAGSADPSAPEVVAALRSLLAFDTSAEPDTLRLALGSCVGAVQAVHADPFVAAERRFLVALELPRHRIAMARICDTWVFAVDDADLSAKGSDPLALLPGYLHFAESVLSEALVHVRAVHEGRVAYVVDGAFSVEGAQVLRRALLAGLDQAADFAEPAARLLLQRVSQAPDAQRKTVPSQSATIACAKAIAERPSLALVDHLRSSTRAIRHAGLKQKVARLLKVAERRLVDSDDFLAELDPALELPKGLSNVVARGFEALLLRTAPLPYETWFARVLANAPTAQHAAALIWRFEDGRSALPVRVGKQWSLLDAYGKPLEALPTAVSLWHPLQPNADAEAWRSLVIARGLSQPFNQAFRETYSAASIERLTLPRLDLHSLLGLARAQGWALRSGATLVRRIGAFRVELDVGVAFPGAVGTTCCYEIRFFRGSGSDAIDPDQAEPQGISECLRRVDLLVSVSAYTLDPNAGEEAASARSRRAVLVRMLGEVPHAERPYVDGRYVRHGELAIHIATGRVSKYGEECELPSLDAKVRVLPYPDSTLQRIVTVLDVHASGRLR